MNKDIVCRGCWALANNCAECTKCLATCLDAKAAIRQLTDALASEQEKNAELAVQLKVARGLLAVTKI